MRNSLTLLALVPLVWFAAGPSRAFAGPDEAAEALGLDPPVERAGDWADAVFNPAPPPVRRWLFVGMQVDVGQHLHPSMKQIYGKNGPFSAQLSIAALATERVGLGVSAGFQRRAGTGVAPSGVTPPEVVLFSVPIAIEGWLRLALFSDQPVVPTLRAGVDLVLAWERMFLASEEDSGEDGGVVADVVEEVAPRKPDAVWMGAKFGLHAAGGVQIRMPMPEIQWDGGMGGNMGVSDVFLSIEGRIRTANGFSREGVDLSSVGASAGITLLF